MKALLEAGELEFEEGREALVAAAKPSDKAKAKAKNVPPEESIQSQSASKTTRMWKVHCSTRFVEIP